MKARQLVLFALAILTFMHSASTQPASAASVTLRIGGSDVLAPLFRVWARDYALLHPDLALIVDGDASHQGTRAVAAGAVDIGGADTFMTDEEARLHPGLLDVALANSAVAIVTALPGLTAPLKLDGPALAAIYRGMLRTWDDRAIAELNPDVPLPHRDIVPVRRVDGAGETTALAQYLATGPSEEDYATLDRPLGTWTETSAPRSGVALPPRRAGTLVAEDDAAMIEVLARTPFAIGYVAYPAVGRAARAGLGIAALRNHADEYLLPDVGSINRAAAALTLRTPPDERISLVDAPGTGCYPLVTHEYAVVAAKRRDEAEASALRDFLTWAIGRDVASFERIEAAGLVALRSSTWLASLARIDLIR